MLARQVAERSILIKNMLEDCLEIKDPIPIPNVCYFLPLTPSFLYNLAFVRYLHFSCHPLQVNDAVLTKVLEWCEQHKNDPVPLTEEDTDTRKKSTDIEEWDQKFMQVDQEMLFEIILVCHS